jgi:plastocyanin
MHKRSLLHRFTKALGLIVLASMLAQHAAAETVTIDQTNLFWSPREIVIHPGDTVVWQWHSLSHTCTEGTDGQINGNELWTSPLNSSTPTFSFTFTPAFLAAHPHPGGRYDYFCQPHFPMGMTGVIFVADPPPGAEFCAGDGSGTACPCNNNSPSKTGCLSTIQHGGRLRGYGTASVSADTLSFNAIGISEGSSVLFFQGTTQVNGGAGATFGDGLRCAGGTTRRIGMGAISFGVAKYPGTGDPHVSVKGGVAPGDVRAYQVFYRDPPSMCTGAHFNTTDGYVLTWLP